MCEDCAIPLVVPTVQSLISELYDSPYMAEAVRQGKTHETYYTKALWYEIIRGGKRSPGGWSSMEVAPSPYLIGVVWE